MRAACRSARREPKERRKTRAASQAGARVESEGTIRAREERQTASKTFACVDRLPSIRKATKAGGFVSRERSHTPRIHLPNHRHVGEVVDSATALLRQVGALAGRPRSVVRRSTPRLLELEAKMRDICSTREDPTDRMDSVEAAAFVVSTVLSYLVFLFSYRSLFCKSHLREHWRCVIASFREANTRGAPWGSTTAQ